MKYITEGMKLNPYYTWDYPYNLGRAYFALGQYEKAIGELQQALERNENVVNARLYLVASYVKLNQIENAEWEVEQLEIISPVTTLSHLEKALPMEDSNYKTDFLNTLRKAGLPE